ncbi:MAG: hypothetical protein Q4C06_06750 [Bacillota bacterium]|nr:hypothetical protein [Bacillota bacterium]
MKKLFALLLTGVLSFSMLACGKTETPKETEMPENMASMAAPIDALARCTLEQGRVYDPNDPEFMWISLFYFVGAYGSEYPSIYEMPETYQLMVIEPAMADHAAALFADFSELPELPASMEGNITYDAEIDTYYVSRGDVGLSETRLTSFTETEEGYAVTAELWGIGPEEELIRAYDVVLVDNPHLEEATYPVYSYSIQSITPVGGETVASPEIITEAMVFNGLTDSHTAELTLPDGSVQPFQFDEASDAAAVLSSLQEGDGVTIGYIADSLKIVTAE